MEKDIFDTEISVYNGVRDVYGTTCKLRAFLFDKKHVPEIEHLRSLPTKEERNEIKKRLPMACISGIFQPCEAFRPYLRGHRPAGQFAN